MPLQFPSDDPCIACTTLANNERRTWVAERPTAITMVPRRVRVRGSLVVLPRRHINSIIDLQQQELEEIAVLVRAAAQLIENAYSPDGLNVWWATGVLAGQCEPHLTIEIVPRFRNVEYKYVDTTELPDWTLEECIAIADTLHLGRKAGEARDQQ